MVSVHEKANRDWNILGVWIFVGLHLISENTISDHLYYTTYFFFFFFPTWTLHAKGHSLKDLQKIVFVDYRNCLFKIKV